MDISFSNERLAKICSSQKAVVKKYGPDVAQRLRQRLDDLQSAANLLEMRSLPGRCHELKGDRAGQLAMDLPGGYRLVFSPDHDPVPHKQDGGLDWGNVIAISVLAVEDYHD